jgi:signal transduction histidine kinase/ActR/RegA family two-component response regulator
MGGPSRRSLEERVLVVAPTLRDAALTQEMLASEGLESEACAGVDAVCRELAVGAGAAILTEESIADGGAEALRLALASQPPWSDFPILVLAQRGADSPLVLELLRTLGNVTLLERPVRVPALVSQVLSALRARRRQYQTREHLEQSERAQEALREADRLKDEFLAMLGHELRNPLAPILHALKILGGSDVSPSVSAQMLQVMDRQVTHLVRLVDDLLDVSRILRGRIELRVERSDLASILSRAIESTRPVVDAQRHHLTIELPDRPIEIEGDVVRLAQVFANLLNNAAKYTDPGGHLALTLRLIGGEAVVRVLDDGVGMSTDVLPHVFDLFHQAQRSLDRAQGGLGLGLTLVRRLVVMHGGSVEARSEGPGRGSEFIVRLPALPVRSEAVPSQAPSGEVFPALPHRRILVVDDNRDAADTLAALLELGGHEVQTAYEGRRAVEKAEQFVPDIVFLDIGLPGLDGYEVARAVRDCLGPATPRLIAVTGYGSRTDRERALGAGFDDHLAKPVELADLVRTLADAPRPACERSS